MSSASVHISENGVQLGTKLCTFVVDRYNEAVGARGSFHVAVSGGSLPKFLAG